ncbi:hypothetical protein B484DRAFT_411514 [Ochromonadaceae sp. CCMP2298]|nr:hypothetical protein B484DRAFT_411514 [Ochromonadaceae sp. CCMP2298]
MFSFLQSRKPRGSKKGEHGKLGNAQRGSGRLNEDLSKLQVPGGPVTQLMLVEVEDQGDPNTGGGKIAAHKLFRAQRLVRVTALDRDVPKYLGGLLKNAFSEKPEKLKEADCEIQDMYSIVETLSTMVVNAGLPQPGQSYGPTRA